MLLRQAFLCALFFQLTSPLLRIMRHTESRHSVSQVCSPAVRNLLRCKAK